MSFDSNTTTERRNGIAPPHASLSPQRFLALLELSDSERTCGIEAHLARMLERAADAFGAAGASIFLERGGSFMLAAKSGADSKVPSNARIVSGKGIAGACVATGQPMIVRDPELSPSLRDQGIHRRADVGSAMVVPLIAPESGCIGVLNLSRKTEDAPFGEDDLALARSIAVYLALAVANARLIVKLNGALEESNLLRAQMEAVLASVPVAILAFDAELRVLFCNAQAASLFSNPPKAGETWNSIKKRLHADLAVGLAKALSGRAPMSAVRVPDERQPSLRTWTLVAGPMPSGTVVALQDETEFERTQEELSRVRRLAEIGQMAAAIAHEIRNPLTGIRGAAQVIRDDPSHASEFGGIIEAEVCKLNTLCEDFLDFARPLRLKIGSYKLSELFANTVKLLRPAFKAAHVKLTLETSPNEPKIKCDPGRIEQVAHNLLRNALEACAESGAVHVEIGHGTASVRDTGCGMSEETLNNLFVPFHTTKAGGTGLGLGNVRRILDAHGAKIAARSEFGEGCEMIVTFGLGAKS